MTVQGCDLAGGEGLAPVAFGRRFAVGAEILVVHRAILAPHRLSGALVEGDQELVITAVEIQKQEIAVQDWRGAGAAIVIADEIATLPAHLAVCGVEARDSRRAERDVDAPLFDGRRGGAVAVELVGELRSFDLEERQVPQDFARAPIDAERRKGVPVLGGGGEPDLLIPHHGRGPGLAVDGRFPGHVTILRPVQRQARRERGAVTARSAELRPLGVVGRRRVTRGADKKGGRHRANGRGEAAWTGTHAASLGRSARWRQRDQCKTENEK